MYPGSKIWDLTPEGGGPPVEVIVGNADEAIKNHPERYTRRAPDGTAQAVMAKRNAERAAAVAKLDEEARAKGAEIEKARQAKLAAIAKEQAAARKAALEKDRAETEKAAKEAGVVPDRTAQIAAINSEADGLHELAQQEAEEKKKALAAGGHVPATAPPVQRPVRPTTEADRARQATD